MLGRNQHDQAAKITKNLEVDPFLNDTKPPNLKRE